MVPKYTSTRDELSDGSKLSDCPYAPSDPRWSTWQKVFIQRQLGDPEAWNRGVERARARMEALGMEMVPRRLDSLFAPRGINNYSVSYIPPKDPPPLDLSKLFAPVADAIAKSFVDLTNIVGVSWAAVDAFLATKPTSGADQILRGIVDEIDPPHLIRGKPAPRPRQAICPRHGKPKGSCRACWR